jgi:hypothetical protein
MIQRRADKEVAVFSAFDMSSADDWIMEVTMGSNEKIRIYEVFGTDGTPEEYICPGHVDSNTFREACQAEYSVKPLVVQHRWRRTKRIVKRDPEKKKARSYVTDVACLAGEQDAQAFTIGLV